MKKFGLAIPTLSQPEMVKCLLESLYKFCHCLDELDIVVSNDPNPNRDARNELKKICGDFKVRYVELPKWGWAVASTDNAIKNCDAEIVGYLNDDMVISENSIETMIEFWERNKAFKLGAVGWMIINAWELVASGILKKEEDFYPPTWNNGKIIRNDLIEKIRASGRLPEFDYFEKPMISIPPTGWAFSIRKDVFSKIGGLGKGGVIEACGMAIWEAGYLVVNIQTPPLLHAQGEASRAMGRSKDGCFGNYEVQNMMARNPGAKEDYIKRWGIEWNKHSKKIQMQYIDNPEYRKLIENMWYWK